MRYADGRSQLVIGKRFAVVVLMLLAATVPEGLHPYLATEALADQATTVTVTVDRGQDVGQCFGSLFETRSADGKLVIGAGFQNAYNTRYRADRHAVQFFIRPVDGDRELTVEELPRPTDNLTGAYLFGRDGRVYSTYGGLKVWSPDAKNWQPVTEVGGTSESMRVGNGTLTFGDSRVTWNGEAVLDPPEKGSYQLFFYANGHLCFYHVNRGDAPYRFFENDEDGFSRLYACPWIPGQGSVDLEKAITLRLPVVGETTFAWGQLGDQIVAGSNIGGFYVFENNQWRMLLEPKLGVSYQLYSTLAFNDRLLMGQYPTGRVFEYDGKTIRDQPGWPPVLEGVSGSAREAQTTAIYGGDLMVGVWPWGEVWRYSPDSRHWAFARRMFPHPELSSKIVHPYDVENQGNAPQNQWGQRVTSLLPSGPDLYISTSAKAPYEWAPRKFPFLLPDKWQSYGKVYRATTPGHLAATTKWTDGPTTFEFSIRDRRLTITQDGTVLATTPLTGALAEAAPSVGALKTVNWGTGIYGPTRSTSLRGTVTTNRQSD